MAWKKLPNAKPTITLTIDEELLKDLEDFQFDNRIKNRSQAIDALLKKSSADRSGREGLRQKASHNFHHLVILVY
jgi:metal-responsive CopG/Arc/MetJ family transcriptional regulator